MPITQTRAVRRGLLVVGLLLVGALLAVSLVGIPERNTTPAYVSSRTQLPNCGVIRHNFGPQTDLLQASQDCFWSARRESRPAEVTVESTTVEGDPVTEIVRLLPDGQAEVFVDWTKDRYGSGNWQKMTCPQQKLTGEDGGFPACAA